MLTMPRANQRKLVEEEIEILLQNLGEGRVEGVAYDTAWVSRLVRRYPDAGFEQCLQWLRHNQYEDGTWGGSLVHYHDRFISTLAAIVALREVGTDPRDERRVKRGEDALWRYVGKLSRDDSDTVGFPILAASLAEEAHDYDLQVPSPPLRFSERYKAKVKVLLESPNRSWLNNSLVVSSEALRTAVTEHDDIFSDNYSVGMSPAATAAHLLRLSNDNALSYINGLLKHDNFGAVPAFSPIDLFEIAWALNELRLSGAISPNHASIKPLLDFLWLNWSATDGLSYSNYSNVRDLDDTAVCFSVLHWAGYPVNLDVFETYEQKDHFCCYTNETNPSVSAQARLLSTLSEYNDDDPRCRLWKQKIVNALYKLDDNGSFWSDKWHSSPYYINSFALKALSQFAQDLASSRYTWIIRTQNDDGGWGYYGTSTLEETAFCLHALTLTKTIFNVDVEILHKAASFIFTHFRNETYPPLWLGKTLYTPYNVVKSVIYGSMFIYFEKIGDSRL